MNFMITPKINYRQPNIDRFIEIIYSAHRLDFKFTYKIENLPKSYLNELRDYVNLFYLVNENPNFYNSYEFPYDYLLDKKHESFKEINRRVKTIQPNNNLTLNDASKTILKNAVNKLNIKDADTIQNIIDLSSVIAIMEDSTEIKPEHIAETIQYLPKYQETE